MASKNHTKLGTTEGSLDPSESLSRNNTENGTDPIRSPWFANLNGPKTVLRPWNKVLEFTGKVSYSESERAWNTIRFRRALIREFPDLKEKRTDIYYHLIFFREYHLLQKHLEELKEHNGPLPMLLVLYRM